MTALSSPWGTPAEGPLGDPWSFSCGPHPSLSCAFPGNKELEPLKYAKVAAAASVSRRKVEGCIQGTMSLLSHCLRKGQNVALILKDIGLLLIEGTKVQMKFYYDFLERLSGKQNLEKVIFKVSVLVSPWRGQSHGSVPALLACGPPGYGQRLGPGESYGPTNSQCLGLLQC